MIYQTHEVDGARYLLVPVGEKDAALHTGGLHFGTHLHAELYRNKRGHTYRDGSPKDRGRKIDEVDLGSGLVTNIFAQALMNDWNLAAPSGAAINLFKLLNFHGSGVGVTAAAATDIALQTAISGTPTTATAGTQTNVTAANLQKYQSVATIAYGTSNAVTEWAIFTASAYSSTTGTPFTAAAAGSFTATATPFTASSATVQGLQQSIVVPGTTAVYALILSNTTSVGTILAWYKVADGTAGSTPGATEAFSVKPIMGDHKVFSAVNVTGGTDSIVFTYALTITSGG